MIKAFSNGQEISAGEQWLDYEDIDYFQMKLHDGSYSAGEWSEHADNTAYAGFYFHSSLDDDWHYGWMDMRIDMDNDLAPTILGYAYETDPNTAIIAGDTGSPVPVPGAVWLVGSGLLGLIGIRKTKSTDRQTMKNGKI